MTTLEAVDLDAVRNLYVVANTPAFLFKQIRALPAVVALGQRPPYELVRALNDAVTRADATEEDLLRGYVALVALSHTTGDVLGALRDARVDRLPWGPQLAGILSAQHKPLITESIMVPPRQSVAVVQPQHANANVSAAASIVVNNAPPTGASSLIILTGSRR